MTDILRRENGFVKCSIKTIKGRKRMKDKKQGKKKKTITNMVAINPTL